MDEKGKEFLKLLFNEGETICVSNNEFGFQSIPQETLSGDIPLISPNEKVAPSSCNSSDLIFVAINPINGWRRDECVTAFRSFMWEIDFGTIPQQLGYFKKIGLPISAQIFSGGKSVHAVTVLDEDIKNEKTYRFLYNWALNILTNCDQNCKNPSRSIRIPGAYRAPGKKQRLITMGKRVKLKDFMDWLNQYQHLQPKPKEVREAIPGEADFSRLSPWARDMLMNGIVFRNGRNQTWFGLAVDLAIAGFSEDEIVKLLGSKFQEEHDFKEREWLITIVSGFKYVQEGKHL